MARRHTDRQVQQRRAEVARLYLIGQRQDKMAEYLEVSPSQITRDLQVLQKEWRASAVTDLGEAKGKELAKLDELEREYWEAWERSKKPRERSRSGRTEGEKAVISAFIETEQRDGNPAFLDGVMKCIAKRCDILGLDAPTSIRIMNEDRAREIAEHYGVDAKALLQTAEAIAARQWDASPN